MGADILDFYLEFYSNIFYTYTENSSHGQKFFSRISSYLLCQSNTSVNDTEKKYTMSGFRFVLLTRFFTYFFFLLFAQLDILSNVKLDAGKHALHIYATIHEYVSMFNT